MNADSRRNGKPYEYVLGGESTLVCVFTGHHAVLLAFDEYVLGGESTLVCIFTGHHPVLLAFDEYVLGDERTLVCVFPDHHAVLLAFDDCGRFELLDSTALESFFLLFCVKSCILPTRLLK
jgi:hypothetical protein